MKFKLPRPNWSRAKQQMKRYTPNKTGIKNLGEDVSNGLDAISDRIDSATEHNDPIYSEPVYKKPAPADTLTFLTVTVKPSGAPSFVASSEKLYCVFAIHTGILSNPSSVSFAISFLARGANATPAPP